MAVHAARREPGRGIARDPRILSGEPTIEGTRVPVRSIVQVFQVERDIDVANQAFPMLDRPSIEHALAFYETHREEIDRYIAENQDDDSS